jgi:hypothetical protein
MKLSFDNWLEQTEALISGALKEIREQHWKEDYATMRWMDVLRAALPHVEITDLGRPYAVAWDALKLSGRRENAYGDVGVFVRIDYPNGVQVEGVGFIEAKRIYPALDVYGKLDCEQLTRMVDKVRHHRLGLYERSSILEAVFGLAGHGMDSVYDHGAKLVQPAWGSVLAAIIPTTVALDLRGNRPSDLHPACLPLSYQLCARYLGGYDLETRSEIVADVKSGGAGAPTFLFISHVVIGGETTPTTDDRLGIAPTSPYTAFEPDIPEALDVSAIGSEASEPAVSDYRYAKKSQRTAPKQKLRLRM